jgi:hypothetical protein
MQTLCFVFCLSSLLGHAIFIWAKSPRRGPTNVIGVACKTHTHLGVTCKFPLAYIIPRTWEQGGSLFSHSFFANPSRRLTLPSHMLEPSSQDLLRGASILNHRCGAFFVEPPSWCLLHKALIQNKHQAFVCDLHSGPSSEAFVQGLRQGLRLRPSF